MPRSEYEVSKLLKLHSDIIIRIGADRMVRLPDFLQKFRPGRGLGALPANPARAGAGAAAVAVAGPQSRGGEVDTGAAGAGPALQARGVAPGGRAHLPRSRPRYL